MKDINFITIHNEIIYDKMKQISTSLAQTIFFRKAC